MATVSQVTSTARVTTDDNLIDKLKEQLRLTPWEVDFERARIVQRSEYCKLVVSRKRLQRCDHLALGIRGLLDLDTGMLFLIEEERLFATSDVR